MIRNIAILAANDLAIALKNKTLYLILFIPLFVYVVLILVDGGMEGAGKTHIGLLTEAHYAPAMIKGLESANDTFSVTWLATEAEGHRWLSQRVGDGLLVPLGALDEGYALVVLAKETPQTITIVEGVVALQRAMEGKDSYWISEIRPLQQMGLQRQLLPTWILMLVLLVGFIILPSQVAEEKEKRLLLGLLQTPIREVEWLLAKVLYGMLLLGSATLFLQLLTRLQFGFGEALGYLAILTVGGFCFSAFGVLIGFLCQTQASARTLGVLFYLPLLLPAALSDYSKSLHSVAPFLPSYQFFQPLKSIMMQEGNLTDFPLAFLFLTGAGLFALLITHRLMKRRWLM